MMMSILHDLMEMEIELGLSNWSVFYFLWLNTEEIDVDGGTALSTKDRKKETTTLAQFDSWWSHYLKRSLIAYIEAVQALSRLGRVLWTISVGSLQLKQQNMLVVVVVANPAITKLQK